LTCILREGLSGLKSEEVRGGGTALYNETLYALYPLTDVKMRVIISRKLRWEMHTTHIGEMIKACKILVGNPKEIYHVLDICVDGSIIFKGILRK
jgi:hypothetical protein